jgi:hypothetical protein
VSQPAPENAPAERPLWLSVLRWMLWLAMLACVVAFATRHGGGAFIYQNF